jgi:hypothetical protein
MRLELLSPLGALFALAVALPLGALAWVERRSERLRSILGLEEPGFRGKAPIVASLVAIPLLLSVALAQPVIRYTGEHKVRTDAELYYVFDVSRSMAAASSPESPRRFDRAIDTAERLHQRLAHIPSGVATMTDRVVPSLFPTGNDEVFTATLEDALTIGQPPPRGYDDVGTLFESLDTLGSGTFYSPTAKHRVAIVLTDGESRQFDSGLLREALGAGPPIDFVVMRFGSSRDRVWRGATPAKDYRPMEASAARTEQLVRATDGKEASAGDIDGVVRTVRSEVGNGPEIEQGQLLRVIGLGKWFALASLVPLSYLLWRRNLS